jgi:hypothetical protein
MSVSSSRNTKVSELNGFQWLRILYFICARTVITSFPYELDDITGLIILTCFSLTLLKSLSSLLTAAFHHYHSINVLHMNLNSHSF